MIKLAFVKYGGLASGGTEIHLQTLAANLPKIFFLLIITIVILHHTSDLTGYILIQTLLEKNI